MRKKLIRENIKTTIYFTEPAKALDWVKEIYYSNVGYLKDSFEEFSKGDNLVSPVHAFYPFVQVSTKKGPKGDTRRSYGYVTTPGKYRATLTRPDIFEHYYLEQFDLLLEHHKGVKLEVGVSKKPIPLHFALGEGYHLESTLTKRQMDKLPLLFDLPNLIDLDDRIANGTFEMGKDRVRPLALFTAPRVDVSLMRLKHYTATSSKHFQNFVLFTNYQFYIDEFVEYSKKMMQETDDPELKEERSKYTAFVEPGDSVTHNKNIGNEEDTYTEISRLPQMPSYHLKRADGSGITLVNIGVGPSNAKTITDHIAVLRPHAWIMLGHCAGLRESQRLGDYVLAHAYAREDDVLDYDLPTWVPVPALAEVQLALEKAVREVTGLEEYDIKKIMRTGTVATISDRNWEFKDYDYLVRRFNQSRAIALEMESGTIAANGFRFRVPYGTLLCVSDKPLHGQLKLPGMADKFYRERVDQHLKIGILAMEKIREYGIGKLHSRKLRNFSEVAFQ